MPATAGQARTGITKRLPGIVGVVNDGAAKQAVLDAGRPGVARINFRINGFAITPRHYAKVREKVESGAISVAFDGSFRSPRTGLPFCIYRTDEDKMTLGFNSASGPNGRALIIHEATHAACDAANYSAMITIESEIMWCRFAQAIFLIVKLGNLPLQADPIIADSQLLADIILGGRMLTPTDLFSITQSILKHPDYIGKATLQVGYNGVK